MKDMCGISDAVGSTATGCRAGATHFRHMLRCRSPLAAVYGTCDVLMTMRTTPHLALVLLLGTACHVDSLFTSPRQPSTGFGLGALSQFQSDSTTTIPMGGSATSASIVLEAVVADSDTTASVRLQVELHPVGTAFTGQATSQSDPVRNGARAYVLESGLAD